VLGDRVVKIIFLDSELVKHEGQMKESGGNINSDGSINSKKSRKLVIKIRNMKKINEHGGGEW